MKTISFELAKRLHPYLKNLDVENGYSENGDVLGYWHIDSVYKAPTLEEAIEFLPQNVKGYTLEFYKCFNGNFNICYVNNQTKENVIIDRLCMFHGPLIGCAEKMLEYLLDNNLLTK